MNTFPMFTKNDVNKFQREITYVNCNNVTEISEAEFGQIPYTPSSRRGIKKVRDNIWH